MTKKICIISEFYPATEEPLFTFVQQLAYSLSNEDIECTIVAPQSISKNIIRKMRPKPIEMYDVTPEGKRIRVLRPYIITFSNTRIKILQWIADRSMEHGIKVGLHRAGSIDAVYCYFWHVGLMTSIAMRKSNIPIFIQASECEVTVHSYMITHENLSRIKHVICASGKNQLESVEYGLVDKNNTSIVVNGYRKDEFHVLDKALSREKLNIPKDIFVIAFVGGFIERKGIRQLSNVLNRLDNVFSIFIGQGEDPPKCKNILFCDRLEHNKIMYYLNCADVFVLPTRAEGCCNAIIEALACGLPVISSNKSFNNEILNDKCSIRIDEQDEEALFNAIKFLRDNPDKRIIMSKEAIKMAQSLTIESRARKIKNIVFGYENK